MKLSGHEINSQLRQKLEMPTGRHLYVVLGTYERLERYEKVDFREARSPSGQRLGEPVNVNHNLLDRINDDELKRLVQTEASRTESVKDRLAKELDALVAEKLNGGFLLGPQEPGTPVRLRSGVELPPHPSDQPKTHSDASAGRESGRPHHAVPRSPIEQPSDLADQLGP